MYGENNDETRKVKSSKNQKINITQSPKTIILEIDGTKYYVPSSQAFDAIVRENTKLKNELTRINTVLKNLTESVKRTDNTVRYVERELANKADIYGED